MKNFISYAVFFFTMLFANHLKAQSITLNNNQKTDLVTKNEETFLTNLETTKQQQMSMKWSTEIFTTEIEATKEFYCKYFGFSVKFELEGFIILQHKKQPAYELLFCVPNLPFNHELFHPAFQGQGVLFQMEVDNVEAEYERIKNLGLPIRIPLVNEPVNGKHFTVVDPNNIPIDIVEFPKE